MPRYEYRCRTCGDTFELSRPMAESSAPAACPAGHDDTVKLLSTVAVGGTASATAPAPRRRLLRRRLLRLTRRRPARRVGELVGDHTVVPCRLGRHQHFRAPHHTAPHHTARHAMSPMIRRLARPVGGTRCEEPHGP